MKRFFLNTLIVVTVLFFASCGNKSNAQPAEDNTTQAPEAASGDFVTHEFTNFSISVPKEFTTSNDASSDIVRFSSEAIHTLDDGTEFSSYAYIDVSFMTGGGTLDNISETASTMKMSEEAKGETCDEPRIDGNVITMRTWHANDDGSKVITWRWWIVSAEGKNVAGNIYYPEEEAKFYDPVVTDIVNSIRIK